MLAQNSLYVRADNSLTAAHIYNPVHPRRMEQLRSERLLVNGEKSLSRINQLGFRPLPRQHKQLQQRMVLEQRDEQAHMRHQRDMAEIDRLRRIINTNKKMLSGSSSSINSSSTDASFASYTNCNPDFQPYEQVTQVKEEPTTPANNKNAEEDDNQIDLDEFCILE
jgi:hypothetical protein